MATVQRGVGQKSIALLRRICQWALPIVGVVLLAGCQLTGGVLDPKGFVTRQEKILLLDSVALMMIVVLPVIIMSFAFAFRYRAKNKRADYDPNWCHNPWLEAIWWGLPCIIIVVLGIMTWKKSHSLDPYRALNVPGEKLVIQAVSLRWKWLFIYPKQNIATVNYIEIPKGRQVEFMITSDAPMSAFFIPQLGSQIYSMAGMRTRLHVVADEKGTYQGLNTQYNGDGFSDMHFKVKVTDTANFNQWVNLVKRHQHMLSISAYQQLVKPTIAANVQYYSSVYPNLFTRIMEQYTKPNMRLH